MEKVLKEKNRLESLNKNLYNNFSIEKLEERLETDPLIFNIELFDLNSHIECGMFKCPDFDGCTSFTCNEFIYG